MHLGKLYSGFDARCNSYSNRISHINHSRDTLEQWKFNHLTEVLLSDIWQAWVHFCRELFFSSCRGCLARNGQIITPSGGNHTWQRLGYIARQASNGHPTKPNGHNSFVVRNEPNWGDLDVFIRVVNSIQPNNHQTILASFGSFSSLKQLQRVRNSCAHKNVETMAGVRQLSSDYDFQRLDFPTDIAWKTNISENVYGIELWVYEMNLIADLTTATP
jgi:hypothetical protein